MAHLLPKRPRLNSVLELRATIEHAQEDLVRARHEIRELHRHTRLLELYVGTADTCMTTVVDIYNRLAVVHGDELPRAR